MLTGLSDRKLTFKKRLLANFLIAGSVFLCLSANVSAALQITKNIDASTTTPAPNGGGVRYNISVTNTGPADLNNVVITDTPVNLNGLSYTVTSPAPPNSSGPGSNQYTFSSLTAGQTVTLDLDATVNAAETCPVINNSASVTEDSGIFTANDAAPGIEYDFEFTSGTSSNVISHLSSSFCEFCDTGIVRIRITNPTTTALQNIVLHENLQSLGLTYINGSTTAIGGANDPFLNTGTELTWDSGDIPALASLAAGATLDITFEVSTFNEASMTADPNRNIIADVTFDTACTAGLHNVNSGQFELPLQQPTPQVRKWGRNYDANQNDWQNTVWGSFNDDIIWRVRVRNFGDAYIEALRINDSITGNFSINYICPTIDAADIAAAANGVVPVATLPSPGNTCIVMTSPFNVVDPFGSAADPRDIGFDGAPESRNGNFYYVGRVQNNHSDETNTADVSWGCAAESSTGGLITTTASGAAGGLDIDNPADLDTSVDPNGLQITQTVTGSNAGQPLGTRGIVTITLNNQTGGSIQTLEVDATLPAGYVVDNTFGLGAGLTVGDPDYGQPNSTQNGSFGTYDGFIDTVTRDDAALLTADPLDDLTPHFTLTSTTTGADAAQQVDMMREDDVITIQFGIIMVDPVRFDIVADLDVDVENTGDGTDPASALTLSNAVSVDFDSVDPSGLQNQTQTQDFINAIDADPEDLDIEISDALFILTNNPGVPLNLNVILTNNGGHDADNYTAYVTLGQAMTAQLPLPTGCVAVTPPAPPNGLIQPLWNQPEYLPDTAAVYACNRGTIAPGAGNAETITFSVVKSSLPVFDDDLTFRADVVGEVHYADSTAGTPNPLLDPPPALVANTTPSLQLANNYSLDGIRSRVLGFNLVQSAWYCAEDGFAEPAPPANILSPAAAPPNLPELTGNLNTQIGEDCTYRIESGGWFGFLTPGFTLIAVQNVNVTEDLPETLPSITQEGQGFIPFGGLPYNFNNTPGITMVGNGGATTTPLDDADITWNFNTAVGISTKDQFFRVDFKTRLLNDNVDLDYALPLAGPNLHGNISTGITRTSFDAVFNSVSGNVIINVDDQAAIPGYPALAERTVDQNEVEPNLIVTKQVCNESLNATGPGCGAFADTIIDGDTNDLYIYRITLTNQSPAPVLARSPAFNVISIDKLDPSGLMLVVDFATDGLDNDGDGFIDALDLNGEGTITGNTVGVPAEIRIDESHSTPLLQIDSGDTVEFFYRVDPHITIAPLQMLTNTVSMTFDSLEGNSGNQNPPQLGNGDTPDSGRARIYTSIDQVANVVMIPLQANPKIVLGLSNTPFVLFGDPHDVTIGEEISYELFANLPVANMRNLTVRDELPLGLRCVEGQTVNLDAPPYDAAGFDPGGSFAATCDNSGVRSVVSWNFGPQQAVTLSSPGDLFNFRVNFIARVENSATTFEGALLTNGGTAIDDATTCTSSGGAGVGICYRDDLNNDIALDFGPVGVTVREPVIALTKTFLPVLNSDAADELTVRVTATNTSTTVAAYNLQILDDLLTADMTYIDNSMLGANVPNDDGVAADSKQPIFSWDRVSNPDYEILPSAVKTFTFRVRVDTAAQPLQILDNTLQSKWDSLPGQDVALPHLIAPAGIGPDGSVLGLRNGALPNVATAPNIYETTSAAASTTVPALTMTKIDKDVGVVVPTIGAHRNFEVVINLPEGTTENLIVDDNLIFGGVSYALSRNLSFDISYQFIDIISINGQPPAEAVFRGATAGPSTLPIDGGTGAITWDIGQVITDEEDDLVINDKNPRIIINYFARPNNDAVTFVGVNMQNSATVNYDHGEGGAAPSINATTAVQTVVEPVLTISKAVTNFTNLGVGPVAGDVLEYIITIDNTGNSEAFDSNIVDTLDDNLLFDGSFTPTALLDGASLAPGVFVPAPTITSAPGGTLTWGRLNADNTIDIPDGSQLVLTYHVIVQNTIEANVDIENSALVDWTSLNDTDPSNAFERTGNGCDLALVAPNIYCSGPAIATITALNSNSIAKAVTGDTYIPPLGVVRVGDIITYQLDVNIQQGTTASVNIRDAIELPGTGLVFEEIVSINGATSAPYTSPAASNFKYTPIPATDVPAANDRLVFNWALGDIVNEADADATNDTLVIIYRARVVENDPDTIPQVPTTTVPPTLRNTADLTFMDGNSSPVSGLNSFADISVVQPLMDLSKIDLNGNSSGDPVDVANDTMRFQLESCNNGNAPAYGLKITDMLDPELDNTSLTVPVVTIGGSPAFDGSEYVYLAPPAGAAGRGGNLEFTFSTPIAPAQCATIVFDIGFYTDFGFGSFRNQVVLNEYFSLPPANAQRYGPLGPVQFVMSNPATAIPPPAKVLLSAAEATIGDEVVYQITVPSVPTGTILYDVTVTDDLHASLLYLSATAPGFTITDTVLAPNTVNLVIDRIPAGQQAVIELRARVDNIGAAQNSVVFDNSASYTYADSPGGLANNAGGDATGIDWTITEPLVTASKQVDNSTNLGQPPDAGDVLLYTIDLVATADTPPAQLLSDAFDVSMDDQLSIGLQYIDNSATFTSGDVGNTISNPVIVNDGISAPQSLSWSLQQGNADIDIVEGTTVRVTYEVLVLDSVLADQNLSNSVDIQWSSRDGPDVRDVVVGGVFQRDGRGLLDDYFSLTSADTILTTLNSNSILKAITNDTYDDPLDKTVRIGDIVTYKLEINLQEGTSPDFKVEDTLPQGLKFEGTVSINGQAAPFVAVTPFSHVDIPNAVVTGDPAAGSTKVTWTPGGIVSTPGDVVNAGDNNITNDDFVIIYRARVLDNAVLPLQIPTNRNLDNLVAFDYSVSGGAAAPQLTSSESLTLLQPNLSLVKTSVPVDGSTIGANDLVTYTVEIENTGDLPAYDTELLDTIPFGLRSPTITVNSITLQPSGVILPNLAPTYNAATGTANWDFDTGTADQYNIPAGQRLVIEYQVQADAGLGTGLSLTNDAQVQFYYSFDNDATPSVPPITGVREIYGPSNLDSVTLSTTPANALLKSNPGDTDISIGETFSYVITVPENLQSTALYDVQILDDLVNDSAADLMFVSAAKLSGSQTFTPENIGSVTDDLIIADRTNGIDIPANQRVTIEVTVTLRNSLPPNDTALAFANTASYTYNQINGDDNTRSNGVGVDSTTAPMDVVEPNLTLVKSGPPGTVNFLAPVPYTVVVENIGDGPAFDTTIVDRLPTVPDNPPLIGGTCDTVPNNIVANIFENNGTDLVQALTQGTHYTATYTAAPTCELVITTITNAADPVSAQIEATQKLIVTYEATLDVGTQSGAILTNTAGVTQWFSQDTAGAGATGETREYTSVLTSSVPVTVEAPVLDFRKTVVLQDDVNGDGIVNPGDTLRYRITIQNDGPTALADFNLIDEVDALAPASGFFASGTMNVITIPAGANDNTNITGGANGAGLLDIRNLSIDPLNGLNDFLVIEFDITLLPVIDSNTIVLNQAQIDSPSTGVLLSDYPVTPGAAEPTPIPVISAPAFLVQKISTDITGDPAVLLPGDTLRYTLTVKNIGQENAINSLLSDQVPANTTYVANSVTLNGLPFGQPDSGVSPLAVGMSINAPEDTTAGFLRADTNPAANNVAIITFDVLVNLTTVNGTIISNQGFFSGEGAGSDVFPQQPTDDPATAAVNDPTLDVVGNLPLFSVLKTVAIFIDGTTPGVVDAGDTLRYTITTTNIGAIPITNAVLTDDVPANSTYVEDSVRLNTLPVGRPDGGISPLIAGIDISTSDLAPPTPGAGTLTPGQSAVVIFDVLVGTVAVPSPPTGTVISNQGFVSSNELPDEASDNDGNASNGNQPTDVTVGSAPLISITKQVVVVGGGAALAGSELEYIIRVTNTGIVPVTNVIITDDLAGLPMTYFTDSGLLNGLPGLSAGVSFDPSTSELTADLSVTAPPTGDLAASAFAELRFRVTLDNTLNIGDLVTNTGKVNWNLATTASASVDITIGGVPGSAILNGTVWNDPDFSNDIGANELLLQDYRVELYQNNNLLANTLTDVNGVFGFSGLPPNSPTGIPYELRYLAPGAIATTATLGNANSAFTDGPQKIEGIFAASGSVVQGLNLPRQANGVVFDSLLRVPVAGVQLSMINHSKSNQPVPGNCFDDGVQANQVTLADGYYKFDLNFEDSGRCAELDEYEIVVLPPSAGFIGNASVIIPPMDVNAFIVPGCPTKSRDQVPLTTQHCEISDGDMPAPPSVAPRSPRAAKDATGTGYQLNFIFNAALFTDQIFNNHIAVDSRQETAVAISKVAGKLNVTRSDLVPYTITFTNTLGVPMSDVAIVDNFPAGFKYVADSARIDGVAVEPTRVERALTWPGMDVDINESRVIKLLLIVGSGVGEGEYVNTAQALNERTGEIISPVATATVRVIPDPTFDCTDIIGKVFNDKNLNAYQDQGEMGVPGVQVATARGLRVTTDTHGRFHITCAIVANEVLGSNFIMKLDTHTLPSGYRVTTENPRVQRATRGKMMKFNFGTAIHRVVRLDLADGVFEKDSTELRPQWESRIELLITELQKEGSILRLSYLGENESEDDVDDRLDAIEELISDRWEDLDCCYRLVIEKEVFWRKGSPEAGREFKE